MSKITENSITIFDAILNIKEWKYVMPAFQRQYVWNMEQIEKLWDSILLDYPIATFLFWHLDDDNITEDTYFCNFLRDVTFNSRKMSDSTNYELHCINNTNHTNTAILDGQQRLTSLYISLLGNVSIRQKNARRKNDNGTTAKLYIELNKHKLTTDEDEYNSKKYDIKFSEKIGKLSPTQFEIKEIILNEDYRHFSTRSNAIEKLIASFKSFPEDSADYARGILQKLCEKIYDEKLVRYTEIYDMKQDDALEMFVRFNSGGKALRKSEITMSILEAYWPSAKKEFGNLLVGSYQGFDSDFIIRTALMLYGDVIKSTISIKIANDLKNNWNDLKKVLEILDSLLKEIKIDIRRFSSSWNVLLPIIYCIYYNPDYQSNLEGIRVYLIRAIIFTYFQSGTTAKLQQMQSRINENNREITVEMLNQMNDLRVTDARIDDILDSEYGGKVTGEILYFLSLEWIVNDVKYEQDHLHPYSRFDSQSPCGVSKEDWIIWRKNRDKLPNLHLLEGRGNASKNNMRLMDYYNDMNSDQQMFFRQHSYIPCNVSLEIEYFGEFYEERKKLLKTRLRELLGV